MGKRKQNQSNTTQRDDTSIANDSELLREFITKPKPYVPIVQAPLTLKNLTQLEDRRAFHPDKQNRAPGAVPRSARTIKIGRSSDRATSQAKAGSLPRTVRFEQPKGVALCVRRKVRREVLFAKRRTRRGAASRTRRRNQWSGVTC